MPGQNDPIAEEVRSVVARRRIPQAELAAHLGLSQAGISRRLSGRTEFSGSELARLAEILDVDVADFFTKARSALAEGDVA